MRAMSRGDYDALVAANAPPAPEFSPRRVLKNYDDMTTSEFQSHLIKLDTTFRGDRALNSGKRLPKNEDKFVHLQSRALLQFRKQVQDDQLQVESLLVLRHRQLQMTDLIRSWEQPSRSYRAPAASCGTGSTQSWTTLQRQLTLISTMEDLLRPATSLVYTESKALNDDSGRVIRSTDRQGLLAVVDGGHWELHHRQWAVDDEVLGCQKRPLCSSSFFAWST